MSSISGLAMGFGSRGAGADGTGKGRSETLWMTGRAGGCVSGAGLGATVSGTGGNSRGAGNGRQRRDGRPGVAVDVIEHLAERQPFGQAGRVGEIFQREIAAGQPFVDLRAA